VNPAQKNILLREGQGEDETPLVYAVPIHFHITKNSNGAPFKKKQNQNYVARNTGYYKYIKA